MKKTAISRFYVKIFVTLVLLAVVPVSWLASESRGLGILGWVVFPGIVLAAIVTAYLARPERTAVRAVSDGLLNFMEHDFGTRLVSERRDDLGEMMRRFNALGDHLRSERSSVYQKEILLSTVIEAAPTAVVIHDEAQMVLLANSPAREILNEGRPLEGRAFDLVIEHLPREVREALLSPEDQLLSFECAGELETFHISRRYFELSTQQHTLIMMRPMTRELIHRELEVWKKTIRIIAHELNNSLAPITSLIHSAKKISRIPEQAHRMDDIFSTIEERARHLQAFLEGYARYARLPSPVKEKVEWSSFLERIRPLYGFAVPEELPKTPGSFDPGQIEQVLINLLKNAVESGSKAEEIALLISEEENNFRIDVLDRGTGMNDEVLKSALLPFYTTKSKGSGLGLPLAREIVEAHGGRLSIERRDGGGTRVICMLPR